MSDLDVAKHVVENINGVKEIKQIDNNIVVIVETEYVRSLVQVVLGFHIRNNNIIVELETE